MERVIAVMVSLTVMAGGILIPAAARAQQAPGGIAGVVKDTSGAVLPGVTVEANVFNASAVLTVNGTYGSQWRQVQSILSGRLLQFSGDLTF